MIRRILTLLAALALLPAFSASADVIQLGDTPCLLQPAAEGDGGLRRYVLFTGDGDYFHAVQNCRDMTALDGLLLIPQGDSSYINYSSASDVVIADLFPALRAWAGDGYEMILIGYSAGGYPATVLAASLAEAGYTGRLILLDGIYGNYRGVAYNEGYYRASLSTWQVTIYASSEKGYPPISDRTQRVGAALADDEFVTYHRYAMSHNEMRMFYRVFLAGAEAPEPVE